MESNDYYELLLRTRVLVAALGERLPIPWWRTEFLSATGLRVGQRIFPRSHQTASVTSVTGAACRDHDVNTGRRSFHLFRFPAHIERQLIGIQQSQYWAVPTDLDSLRAELSAIQSSVSVQAAPGPKSLGSVDGITKTTMPATLASLYQDAASKGIRVYPYFEAVGDE